MGWREDYKYRNSEGWKEDWGNSTFKKKSAWPPEANEADFKKMYRNLAKMHHPDIGGSTAKMADINKFYHGKDWGSLKDMFTQSGLNLELSDIDMDMIALFIKVLFEAVKDGNEYALFPVSDDVDEVPPFIIITDEGKRWLIIDKNSAALIVGTVLNNWKELKGYLENEGDTRSIPSEG